MMEILNKESALVTFIAEMRFKGNPKETKKWIKEKSSEILILMNLKPLGLNGFIQKMKPRSPL